MMSPNVTRGRGFQISQKVSRIFEWLLSTVLNWNQFFMRCKIFTFLECWHISYETEKNRNNIVRVPQKNFQIQKLRFHWTSVSDCVVENKDECRNFQKIFLSPIPWNQTGKFTYKVKLFFGKSCGLAVEHSDHDLKVVGSIPVQSNARMKWC